MKIQQWKRITKTDIPDLPDWAKKIVDPVNRQLEVITTALQAHLTFGDNFAEPPRTLELKHDTVTPIRLKNLKRNPVGVVVLATSFNEYWRMTWEMNATEPLTVDVRIKWDTVPSADPEVTLLFLGGP